MTKKKQCVIVVLKEGDTVLDLYKNIKKRREELGFSQDELAKKMGYTSRSSIAKIESGTNDIPQSKIVAFAEALNTTPAYLMGWETAQKPSNDDFDVFSVPNIHPIKLKKFPLLGEIACGEPIFADEDKENYIMADHDIKADFCLVAKGDSMINARIFDGDTVFIKKQPIVDNGEIAAVIIDDEATLKRVYYDKESNVLTLMAENPKFKSMVFTDSELDTIRILGKAVYFTSMVI